MSAKSPVMDAEGRDRLQSHIDREIRICMRIHRIDPRLSPPSPLSLPPPPLPLPLPLPSPPFSVTSYCGILLTVDKKLQVKLYLKKSIIIF